MDYLTTSFKTCSNSLSIRTLRRGKHRLLLWLGIEADGSIESTTPSKLASQDEMGRLEKVRDYASFTPLGLTLYY